MLKLSLTHVPDKNVERLGVDLESWCPPSTSWFMGNYRWKTQHLTTRNLRGLFTNCSVNRFSWNFYQTLGICEGIWNKILAQYPQDAGEMTKKDGGYQLSKFMTKIYRADVHFYLERVLRAVAGKYSHFSLGTQIFLAAWLKQKHC